MYIGIVIYLGIHQNVSTRRHALCKNDGVSHCKCHCLTAWNHQFQLSIAVRCAVGWSVLLVRPDKPVCITIRNDE
jgi:hypothetical protein